MTLVSGGIRFMRIFAEIPRKGASNESGVVENGNLRVFAGYFSDTFDMRPALLYGDTHSPSSAFQ